MFKIQLKKNKPNWKVLAKATAVCLVALMPVFMAFANVVSTRHIMIFAIGNFEGVLGGVNIANAATISGLKPTACGGTNAVTGGTYTQPTAKTGDRSYCYGIYTCTGTETQLPASGVQTGNVNTCINPVTGAQMTPGYQCRVGNLATGYGTLFGRDLPQSVVNCSCQGIEFFGACTTLEKGGRMPGVSTVIKNGCATEYLFSEGGSVRAQARCAPQIDATSGTVVNTGATSSTSGGATSTGSNGGTTTGSSTGSTSGNSNQTSGNVIGWIERASLTEIKGWAAFPTRPDLSVDVRLYLKKQGQNSLTFVTQATANVTRPDVSTLLGFATTASNKHGFSIPTPSGAKAGDSVIVYGVNPDLGWNPSLGEKVIGSSDTSAPSSFSGTGSSTGSTSDGRGTSTGSGNSGGTFGSAVSGLAPRTWDAWESYCASSNAGVCLAPVGDGGQSCIVTGGGSTQDQRDICEARYNACGGGNRGGVITGFCDPGKYIECKEAGMVDSQGRINLEQCDQALIDAGCADSRTAAASCRPECILPGGNKPSDCPATTLNQRDLLPPRDPSTRTTDCVVGSTGPNGCQRPIN